MKKNTLGLIALCLCLFGSLALITANADSVKPKEVRVLMAAAETGKLLPFAEKFNSEQQEVKLILVEGPNDTNAIEDIYTSSFLLGNTPYDLVYIDVIWTAKFAAAGWLHDLTDWAQAELELEDFDDTSVRAGRYRDKIYRIPFKPAVGMLYYRKDLVNEQGFTEPPQTFNELTKIASNQREGMSGYVWQGKQYEGLSAMFVEVLKGFGAYWVDPETSEVGLDSPEAIAAVDWLVGTMKSGVSPSGVTTYAEEEVRRIFQNGRAVFMRNWPYAWPLAQSEDSAVADRIGIVPMVGSSPGSRGSCLGGWGFAVSESSPNKDASLKVIEYFSSLNVQKAVALEHGFLPVRTSLYSDEDILIKFPHYADILAIISNAVLRPPVPKYAQISDVLQRYLSAALTEVMTSKAAMEQAAQETRAILGVTNEEK